MNGAERLLQVFLDMGPPDRALVWAADRLLDLAVELPAVHIRKVAPSPDRPDEPATFELSDGVSTLETTAERVTRIFRPLMPRFAVLGAQEMGIESPLYGGRVFISRVADGHPIRLDVDFSNTPGAQWLDIIRVPAGPTPHVNGSTTRPLSAGPTAG
ncbi:MAG: hypothetical protein U0871_26645 [Gemmataceae bacterium]